MAERARELAGRSTRPADATGIELTPLDKTRTGEEISYPNVTARLDRDRGVAEITVRGPGRGAAGQHRRRARAGRRASGRWP